MSIAHSTAGGCRWLHDCFTPQEVHSRHELAQQEHAVAHTETLCALSIMCLGTYLDPCLSQSQHYKTIRAQQG